MPPKLYDNLIPRYYWNDFKEITISSSTESIRRCLSDPITVSLSPDTIPNISIDCSGYDWKEITKIGFKEIIKKGERSIPKNFCVDKIVKSGPVTIVFWEDGTKTIVRKSDGAEDNPYNAFCAALAKKMYGTNSSLQRMIANKTVEQKKKEKN